MNSILLPPNPRIRRSPRGYTLVEMLVAITLTLIMMAGVATFFGRVGQSITDSRSTLEMTDRLRAVQLRLQEDLANVTVTMDPPRDPADDEGYFEVTEGPIGPVIPPGAVAVNLDVADASHPTGYAADTTVGDIDDMLMFTTRSKDSPFTGRVFIKRWAQPGEQTYYDPSDASKTPVPDGTGQFVIDRTAISQDAEIAWFVRGSTLYRRVLLVLPHFDADLRVSGTQMQLDTRRGAPYTPPFPVVSPPSPGFHNDYDVSIYSNNDTRTFSGFNILPNSLGSLTKPENRYSHRIFHQYLSGASGRWSGYPFHPHFRVDWTTSPATIVQSQWYALRLPTLAETAFRLADGKAASDPAPLDPTLSLDYGTSWRAGWPFGTGALSFRAAPYNNFDAWTNPHPIQELEPATGTLNDYVSSPQMQTRVSEDVILTNVVGFDVKVWDPGAPLLTWTPTGGSANALVPGDPRYAEALRHRATGTAPTPVIIGYGAYVDLNYMCLVGPDPANAYRPRFSYPANAPAPQFHGPGDIRSMLPGTLPYAKDWSDPLDWPTTAALRSAVYDTWSNHYERDEPEWIDRNNDGTSQSIEVEGDQNWDGVFNEGTNGFDDNGNGIVDEDLEQEAPPPYRHPLRGVQVKIRVFEPDSRQIREVTVVQEFTTK